MVPNVVFVARMVLKMSDKTKPRLIVMDHDCDLILDRVPKRMRSVYIRSAIKHYHRWKEHGDLDFDDLRLNKYGTRDVNLRITELEDQVFEWQDRYGSKNLEIQQLKIDIEALTRSQQKKRWWKFW